MCVCEREIVGGWIEIGRERAGGGGERRREEGRKVGREGGMGREEKRG